MEPLRGREAGTNKVDANVLRTQLVGERLAEPGRRCPLCIGDNHSSHGLLCGAASRKEANR